MFSSIHLASPSIAAAAAAADVRHHARLYFWQLRTEQASELRLDAIPTVKREKELRAVQLQQQQLGHNSSSIYSCCSRSQSFSSLRRRGETKIMSASGRIKSSVSPAAFIH
jgi:hypothetical protein